MDALTFDTNGRQIDDSPFVTVKLSWVAYIGEIAQFFIRVLVLAFISVIVTHFVSPGGALGKNAASWPAMLALLMAIALTAYSVAYTRSVHLFTNDGGVWMSRGVFPWEKGVTGVQWRDVGQAGFSQGALSWALKSYNLSITHRFTQGAELSAKHVKHGDMFVQHVNSVMAQIQRRGL
jgi:hypothetical protein